MRRTTTIDGIVLFINLIITGHLGGNITHGEDHLTEPLPDSIKLFLNKDSVKEEYTFKSPNYLLEDVELIQGRYAQQTITVNNLQLETEFIIITENSIYVVSSDIATKRVS